VVFVPDKRIKEVGEPTNQVHTFRLKNVPAYLRIQFMAEGKPRANSPYSLKIDGEIVSEPGARTDSSGFVISKIPPLAKNGILMLGEGGEQTEYILQLGDLNPVNELTGVKQRLRNMGIYNGRIDQDINEKTKDSIRSFQASSGLNPTGELDEVTRSKLEQTHDD
jgi:N-acetylmuramoyl-L-alanine amidase